MKIFEVAGEGKLHGLTVMSLDKFVKKEDDVEESITEDVGTDAKIYQNKMTGKFVAWVEIKKNIIKQEGDTREEALQNLTDYFEKTKATKSQPVGRHLHKQDLTTVGFNNAFVSGILKMSGQSFFAQFNDGKLLVSTEPKTGFRKVSNGVPSPTGTFSKNDIENAGLSLSQRYDITPIDQTDSGLLVFKLSHHSNVSHPNDRLHRPTPSLTIQLAGRNLKEFAPGAGGDESGRWYTDDELADIIGDDWFEDFDVSNDGFNIDAYGEKAKQNLVGYANSWFDDKGYNVNVMGVEHNDVDHDLKWYIVGSFQNDNFAKKDLEEIDRRGFLKGMGAAAVAGAAGYELGKPNIDTSVYKNPKAVFLIGYLHAAKEYMPRDRETLEINSIIEDYLAYTKGNAMDLHSGSSKFFNDVGAYNRQHKIGRPGYTEVFDDDVEQKKWIQSQGREALNQLKGLTQKKESVQQGVAEDNSAVIASTADRLSNKDDGRTAKLRAAGDARREQHLKGRDIAKNDRSSKDAWGDLKERASQLLSAEDRNGVITVIVQAPDGTKKSLANDNPNYINQWLSAKYGLTLPKSITSKFAGMNEAPGDFGLGANYRAVPDAEMQDLMGRSKNKTKTKRDKYDYPYIHGSNIEVKDEAGKKFDTEKLKAAIMTRPANILGQNAKMQHSETGTEAIFDIGLPALKGLAVNEKTGEFVVVDTCPGAGACQTYCYAMKGSYVMFKAVSMGLARMLNFLLNDPAGFADKLNSEIAAARSKYAKKGAKIVVRWHDAGDFFSPEYMDMAYGVAKSNPDVGFYAYTKMGDVANAARPANFNMNFSQGAKTGQEKKVNITRTKHSKVVPKDMFFDLIARKGNELIKDAKGRMQFASPENMDKFKTTMAQKYAIDKNSILTYDQMMKTPVGDSPKWNVIVMPGDGDNSANRNDVVGSYLLFH